MNSPQAVDTLKIVDDGFKHLKVLFVEDVQYTDKQLSDIRAMVNWFKLKVVLLNPQKIDYDNKNRLNNGKTTLLGGVSTNLDGTSAVYNNVFVWMNRRLGMYSDIPPIEFDDFMVICTPFVDIPPSCSNKTLVINRYLNS